ERGVERDGERLPCLGLPDPRLALQEQWLGQAHAEEERGGEALVDEVVDVGQAPRQRLDVGDERPDLVRGLARDDGHCGGSARPCIAAHTRAGVQGMSMWSTPCASCSASITALTIAGGEPTFGDSPTPLAPSGWWGQGVTVSPSSKSGHSSAVGMR